MTQNEKKESGETHYNHSGAEECTFISDLLFRTAEILHDLKTDRTPLNGYGLNKPVQFKAAAKVLRILSGDLIGRAKTLRKGKV